LNTALLRTLKPKYAKKDAQPFWISISLKAVRDQNGTILYLEGTCTDITKRKQAEDQLKESEIRYRTIFEIREQPCSSSKNKSLISLANREFEELTGYTRDEIEGKKRWTEFIAEKDSERMKVQHRLRREDPDSALKSYEFTAINRSGQIKNILMAIDMIPGTIQSVASLLDITERKSAETALRDSEEKYRKLIENSVMGIGVSYGNKVALLTHHSCVY